MSLLHTSPKAWAIKRDPANFSDNTILSLLQASRYLEISDKTLARHVKKGNITPDLKQGIVGFRIKTLKKFIAEHIPAIRQSALRAGFGTMRSCHNYDYAKLIGGANTND